MISDLARLTYMGKERLMKFFNRKDTVAIEEVKANLEKMVEKLANDHKSSEEAIERLKVEASELLEELRIREEKQIKEVRATTSEWLCRVGVDPSHVDEFIKDTSFEKLEELRSKYPYPKK